MILNGVVLPMPPTINNYYCRARSGGVYCDEKVVSYRKMMALALKNVANKATDRLALGVGFAFPTNKVQDLDNRLKGLQDAMQFAKIFKNDSQIDFLVAWRMQKSSMSGGHCAVWLGTMPDDVFTIASQWIGGGV